MCVNAVLASKFENHDWLITKVNLTNICTHVHTYTHTHTHTHTHAHARTHAPTHTLTHKTHTHRT